MKGILTLPPFLSSNSSTNFASNFWLIFLLIRFIFTLSLLLFSYSPFLTSFRFLFYTQLTSYFASSCYLFFFFISLTYLLFSFFIYFILFTSSSHSSAHIPPHPGFCTLIPSFFAIVFFFFHLLLHLYLSYIFLLFFHYFLLLFFLFLTLLCLTLITLQCTSSSLPPPHPLFRLPFLPSR